MVWQQWMAAILLLSGLSRSADIFDQDLRWAESTQDGGGNGIEFMDGCNCTNLYAGCGLNSSGWRVKCSSRGVRKLSGLPADVRDRVGHLESPFGCIPGNATELFPLMENLTVANCEGMSELSSSRLRRISIQRSKAPPGPFQCESLESLQISGSGLSNIPDLSGMPNIRALFLDKNTIREFRLGSDTIRTLDLSGNSIGRVTVDMFQDATKLERLSLAHNPVVSIEMGALTQLVSLKWLDLSATRLSSVPSPPFWGPTLESLFLSDANLNNVESLGDLPFLTRLRIDGNGMREMDFFASLPNLRNLDISRNGLSRVPPSLFGLGGLENLRASANPFECACELVRVLEFDASVMCVPNLVDATTGNEDTPVVMENAESPVHTATGNADSRVTMAAEFMDSFLAMARRNAEFRANSATQSQDISSRSETENLDVPDKSEKLDIAMPSSTSYPDNADNPDRSSSNPEALSAKPVSSSDNPDSSQNSRDSSPHDSEISPHDQDSSPSNRDNSLNNRANSRSNQDSSSNKRDSSENPRQYSDSTILASHYIRDNCTYISPVSIRSVYSRPGKHALLHCNISQPLLHTDIEWTTPDSDTIIRAANGTNVRVLSSGSLFVQSVSVESLGRYECVAYGPFRNVTSVVVLRLDAAILEVTIISVLVGLITGLVFLLVSMIFVLLRLLAERNGWCLWLSKDKPPKGKNLRHLLYTVEHCRMQQLDKLRENYHSQVQRIRDNFAQQVERIRDSYQSQVQHLRDFRNYGTQQLTLYRNQYQEQVRKVRGYSVGQLGRVRENYIYQRNRVRKFSADQFIRLRETYKFQQQTLVKIIENLPVLYLDNCRNGMCRRTESVVFDEVRVDVMNDPDGSCDGSSVQVRLGSSGDSPTRDFGGAASMSEYYTPTGGQSQC